MKTYDLMYSKDALNIYIYLFSNKNFDKEKEYIIKNILYVMYMFSFYYEKTKTIEKLYQLFQKIDYIEDVNDLLNEDSNLNQFYRLFSICKDILREDKKNKYQLYLVELKYSILNSNINDILYFMKTKNELDEICERICNKTISQKEWNIFNNELEKKLQYLEKYFPVTDIEAYKTYLKFQNNENSNSLINIGIKLFESNKGEITFSELKQLEDLQNKVKTTKDLKFNHFENLKMEKEECNKIIIYAIKKVLKGIIEVIIFYLLIGRFCVEGYKDFINTNNIYMLMPFGIWIMIIILYIAYFFSYLLVIFKSKRNTNFKGMIGFIANINWSYHHNARKFYDIYFPKQNVKSCIRTSNAINKLKRKSMVKLLRVANKKIVVPINDNV